MLFARWQHHIRFGSGFPYAPFKAMLTKISKWSRIQDSFQITPKIESLVVFAIPDILSKFQKDPSITFWVILLTHRQTDSQTNKLWQKHNLLGGGNKYTVFCMLKIRRRDDRKWLFTFPFPLIPMQLIPISSHSRSQTIVQSLEHKQLFGLPKTQTCLSLNPKLITTVSIMLCTTEHHKVTNYEKYF